VGNASILHNTTVVLENIELNITQYYIQYYSILHWKLYNITQYYRSIE